MILKKITLLISIFLLISCNENNKKSISNFINKKNYTEDIIGEWVIDYATEYSNGEELKLNKDEKEEFTLENGEKFLFAKNDRLIGSTQNPKYYKFTKYNEVFVYNKTKDYDIASKYEISDDNIIMTNIILKERDVNKIIKLNKNELILRDEMDCIGCDENELRKKTIWTFYFKKVSN